MVLHRRTAEDETVFAIQEPGGLGRLAGGILDRLRFVQDDIIKSKILEHRRIVAKRSIRREDQIVRSKRLG